MEFIKMWLLKFFIVLCVLLLGSVILSILVGIWYLIGNTFFNETVSGIIFTFVYVLLIFTGISAWSDYTG